MLGAWLQAVRQAPTLSTATTTKLSRLLCIEDNERNILISETVAGELRQPHHHLIVSDRGRPPGSA